ncbi:hypothetical protein PK28_14950 [Hymenobacter sp. DG25B]|uniref:DUF5777 family beta-barrel protein n=1 Tax=Hymenobacter sp. DG25B TaxID=1385664 RepID=UPI000540A026|nr:DUF5777 family beta-barrel protein [Hymenobacter sp. DG25B]AIZ64641.1 hypothetical protein PK28_14950 [Hymenobacter sp. DG25B]
MRCRYVFSLLVLLTSALLSFRSRAQDTNSDLLRQLNQQVPADSAAPVAATFKGTRVINGQSVETPRAHVLLFLISHRFGPLNSGAYNFFGLDQATIRLGLEYGITDRLAVGIGRSSLEKTFDGFAKYRLLRQQTGSHSMPVSVTLLGTTALTSLRYGGPERPFRTRLAYTGQALVARKISNGLSLQLMPTFMHRNLVDTPHDQNDVWALGVAGRQKLTQRVAFTAEYYYVLPGATATDFRNSLALGFDIETGGHVFQLHVTNAQGMIEPLFIPRTTGNFFDGDIFFGFNISRAFALGGEPGRKW